MHLILPVREGLMAISGLPSKSRKSNARILCSGQLTRKPRDRRADELALRKAYGLHLFGSTVKYKANNDQKIRNATGVHLTFSYFRGR